MADRTGLVATFSDDRLTVRLPESVVVGHSQNDRTHWRKRAVAAKTNRETVAWLVRPKRVEFETPVRIVVTYYPADRRRRDPDGLAGVGKHFIDGLVDAGILEDDDSTRVRSVTYAIAPHVPDDPAAPCYRMEVTPCPT